MSKDKSMSLWKKQQKEYISSLKVSINHSKSVIRNDKKEIGFHLQSIRLSEERKKYQEQQLIEAKRLLNSERK